MRSLPRIGTYLALFVAFVVGALLLQTWLQRQMQTQLRALNAEAITSKRAEFTRALAARALADPAPLDELAAVARAVGLTLQPSLATPANPPDRPGRAELSFMHRVGATTEVTLTLPIPPAARLLAVYHRVTVVLLWGGPLLFGFGLLVAGLGQRTRKEERGSRPPWAVARAEAASLENLARLSHERTEALSLAQEARARAEQDSQLNRSMLDHSLSERVRLGRELHDNICQTLYAVCLTLESVHKKNTLAPELAARIEQCMAELKRVNGAVRAYLQELGPERVHEDTFEQAMNVLLASFSGREGVKIESRVAPDVIARIAPAHIAEVMNILREAVSNALRHGRASVVTIRAASSEEAIALSVVDDGEGFVPRPPRATADGGHGLANMEARARELGGKLHVESAPGQGTRVSLTLPVASPV